MVDGGTGTDRVVLNDDAVFHFPLGDWYWTRYKAGAVYEVEIDRVLRRAADRPYAFVDAGANFGYWSVLVSSSPYGAHPVVAVEASRQNYEQLAHNARANGDRFRPLHRAVLDRSGEQVSLHGEKHYGRSLHRSWHPEDAPTVESVVTITLDEVAETYLPQPLAHPPVLKLDVEGVEVEAISGAAALIDQGALVIYEDHGKEPSHRTSGFVLSLPDMAVWRDTDAGPARITTLDQVAGVKQDPTKGYNFLAHRLDSPWSTLFTS